MLLNFVLHELSNNTLLMLNCLLFLLLNVLDGWTTWLVIKPDHYSRERNPVARWVFRRLKIPAGIVLFKALLLGFLGVFIAYWWREALTINIALTVGNLLYIYVVQHNLRVHKKYERQERFYKSVNCIVAEPD